MCEDSNDHRRLLNACPEPAEGAAMIFKRLCIRGKVILGGEEGVRHA
jgi:hypothetical protein